MTNGSMMCYIFGQIPLDKLEEKTKTRLSRSLTQTPRGDEYDLAREKAYFLRTFKICQFDDKQLQEQLKSSSSEEKAQIQAEIKRRGELIKTTGGKKIDPRCQKFNKLNHMLNQLHIGKTTEEAIKKDREIASIYEKYLLYTQPKAVTSKAELISRRPKADTTIDQVTQQSLATAALEKFKAMKRGQIGYQVQHKSAIVSLEPLAYTFNPVENKITSDHSVTKERYLPEAFISAVFLDPTKTEQNIIAPWLSKALKIDDELTIKLFERLKPVGSLGSQSYRLTLENGEKYFIKIEAASKRIKKQAAANKIVNALGLDLREDDPIFVNQLASVVVEFGDKDSRMNEIIVFPEIEGASPRLNDTEQWYNIGKALAKFKIASMKHAGTYDHFLKTGNMSKVLVLPDLHFKNIILQGRDKIYFIDYQLINDQASPCFDMKRLMLDINSKETRLSFKTGFLSEFPNKELQKVLNKTCLKEMV